MIHSQQQVIPPSSCMCASVSQSLNVCADSNLFHFFRKVREVRQNEVILTKIVGIAARGTGLIPVESERCGAVSGYVWAGRVVGT